MTDRLLFADEIAELAGLAPAPKGPRTISYYLQEANRARREGTATAAHLPAPAARADRTVFNGHHDITVRDAPQWRAGDVAEWLENRKGPAATRERCLAAAAKLRAGR